MFHNIALSLVPGGRLLLVVPSLESAMYTRHRLVEWNLRDGLAPNAAVRRYFEKDRTPALDTVRQGLVDVDGVPTKHFLREELISTLAGQGLHVEKIQKINYSWSTEFVSPPRWMREPYPWDWMVLAEKQ